MATGPRDQGQTDPRSLLYRLQQRIDQLQAIDLHGEARLQVDEAIASLQQDVEDLSRIGPYIFAPADSEE
jgi:hypothetical protein